ncbi:MAG: AraC family transcriptional regulator [Ruminococcaceae bacterium]|nr:AraC family transcriptional regulator [Oscillospiraceae bacterium]
MKKLQYREERQHGVPDFPVQYYHINEDHPRYEMNLHWHREIEIVRILQGELSLYLDSAEHLLCEGEVAFVGSGVLHRAEPRDCVYECVVFDLNLLARHGPGRVSEYALSILAGDIENRPIAGERALILAVGELFSALAGEGAYYELKVYSAIANILYLLYRGGRIRLSERHSRQGSRRQSMALLLDWIEQNYADRITLTELAAVAGSTEKYLCRFFKEYTGNSPVEYINRLRVERACLSMAAGDRSITEIAMDSGFNDISYFCKIFKRYKGVSPREYRRRFEKRDVV